MLLVQLAALAGLVASADATTQPLVRRRQFSKHHHRSDWPYHQHDPHAARSLAVRAAAPSQQASAPCSASFEKVNGACGAQDTGAVACAASLATIYADSFSSPSWTKSVTNGVGSVQTIDGVSRFVISGTGSGASASLSYPVPPLPAGSPFILLLSITLAPGSSFQALTITFTDTSSRRSKRGVVSSTTFCMTECSTDSVFIDRSSTPGFAPLQLLLTAALPPASNTVTVDLNRLMGFVGLSPWSFQPTRNPFTTQPTTFTFGVPPLPDLAAIAAATVAEVAAADEAARRAACNAKGQSLGGRSFCTDDCTVQREKRQTRGDTTSSGCGECLDTRASYDAAQDKCVCTAPYTQAEGAERPGTCNSSAYCTARGLGVTGNDVLCTTCTDPNARAPVDICACDATKGYYLRSGISRPVALGDCVSTLCLETNSVQENGYCGACIPNSTISVREGKCVCNDHFDLINHVCVPFTDLPSCTAAGRITATATTCGRCIDPARTLNPATQACDLSTDCETKRLRTNPDLTCLMACKDADELPNASGVCDRTIRASCLAAGRPTNPSSFECRDACISSDRIYNPTTQRCDISVQCLRLSRDTLPDFTCGQQCYIGGTRWVDLYHSVDANGECKDLNVCLRMRRKTVYTTPGGGASCGDCINPDEGRDLSSDSTCGLNPTCETQGRRTQANASCGACKDSTLAVGPSGTCELSSACVAAGRATVTATTCGACTNPSLVLNPSTQACESPVCAAAQRQTNVSIGTCGSCLPGISQDGNGACTLSSACVAAGRVTGAGGVCGPCSTQGRVLNSSTGSCDLLQTCQDQGRLTSSSFTCTTCIDPALQVDGATGRCTIRSSCESQGRDTEQATGYACGACKAGPTTPANDENGACSLSVICNSTGRYTLDPTLPGVEGCGGCSSIRFSMDSNGQCTIGVSCASLGRTELPDDNPEYYLNRAGCMNGTLTPDPTTGRCL